jgi:hypothetical protein
MEIARCSRYVDYDPGIRESMTQYNARHLPLLR